MAAFDDLSGREFGMLRVVRRVANDTHGRARWECLCKCGVSTEASATNLKQGKYVSCGCEKRRKIATVTFSHGLASHPLYSTWKSMLRRCSDPKHESFQYYGARGIKVFAEWRDSPSEFIEYVEKLPGAGEGLEIDRIDNDGDYEPGNLRWATRQQQILNKRSKLSEASGLRGVYLDKRDGRWYSQILRSGKLTYLGRFDTREAAHRARLSAEAAFIEDARDFLSDERFPTKEASL